VKIALNFFGKMFLDRVLKRAQKEEKETEDESSALENDVESGNSEHVDECITIDNLMKDIGRIKSFRLWCFGVRCSVFEYFNPCENHIAFTNCSFDCLN